MHTRYIKLKKGQYIGDVLSELPINACIDKILPNLGATTAELLAERHSLLMQPNVPVIKGKATKEILGVYEGITLDNVIEYMSSAIPFKKILVTPESFFKVHQAAAFLNINLYEEYMFLFDESDRITQDVAFRKKIVLPMDDFFKFKNKAFISATPLNPSDPRFCLQGFEKVVLDPVFDYSKDVKLITTNNVFLSFKNALEKHIAERYCIFFNSTNMIGAFIKKLEIEDDSHVFCSRESAYQLKMNGIKHVSDHLQDFKKYNFFTSRFNSAVDIYLDTKPTVFILTDLYSATHSMVHPSTESVQIVGRFRHGVGEVLHITNLDGDLSPKSDEQVAGWLSGSEQTYSDIKALYQAATNDGARDTLKECLKLVTYSTFVNADGSKNYFMRDNLFFEEDVKRAYVSQDAFVKAYSNKHFNVTHLAENFPLDDKKEHQLKNGIAMITIVNSIIESLGKIKEDDETFTISSKKSVLHEFTKSFPEIMQAYRLLGPEKLKKVGFSKKQIKKAIREEQIKNDKSNYGFLTFLQNSVEEGVDYSSSDLRQILTRAIAANKLSLQPNLNLLEQYFEMSKRKTIGFDRDGKKIKGFKVLRSKFNKPD